MYLATIASKCTYNYGAMGRVGYLYDSAKDQLKWHSLSVKSYIKFMMNIGEVMALKDEDYQKEKVRVMKMETIDMAEAFTTAFGDGNG